MSVGIIKWRPNIYFEYYAGVAQLVERLTCNEQAGGSNPSASSIQIVKLVRKRFFNVKWVAVIQRVGEVRFLKANGSTPQPKVQNSLLIRACSSAGRAVDL